MLFPRFGPSKMVQHMTRSTGHETRKGWNTNVLKYNHCKTNVFFIIDLLTIEVCSPENIESRRTWKFISWKLQFESRKNIKIFVYVKFVHMNNFNGLASKENILTILFLRSKTSTIYITTFVKMKNVFRP